LAKSKKTADNPLVSGIPQAKRVLDSPPNRDLIVCAGVYVGKGAKNPKSFYSIRSQKW
jgi:hypothetical protein